MNGIDEVGKEFFFFMNDTYNFKKFLFRCIKLSSDKHLYFRLKIQYLLSLP